MRDDLERLPRGRVRKRERRATDRFPVERDLHYKLDSKSGRDSCIGKTINISGTGVCFSSEDPPSVGTPLVIAISCPNEEDAEAGMKLLAKGRVVRSDANSAAIEVEEFEFRTLGAEA